MVAMRMGMMMACVLAGLAAPMAVAETGTPVTMERTEGPLQDLEVFGEDGFFHVLQQDIIVTIRTVEGRPLTYEEQQESKEIAVDCGDGRMAFDIVDGESADGAYVVSFTCE
jgi:hypothetical protein